MPIYKEGDRYRVRIWNKGQKKDWWIDGTKKDAEAFEARERVKMAQAGELPASRVVPTFFDFCAKEYKAYAESHLKARTWSNRQYQLATLTEHFGSCKLTDITTVIAEDFKKARRQAGIEPTTINSDLKALRAVLNHAHYLGVPAIKLKVKDLPERGQKRLQFWTSEQVARLLDAASEHAPSIYWLILFLLETGCRRGEALALQFCDIDLEHGLVRIQPNEEWQPKDNEAREIPIDKTGVLYAWLKDDETSGRQFVFVNRKKEPYAYWPQRKFDRVRAHTVPQVQRQTHAKKHKGALADCAECQRFALQGGAHTTRHTFATHFLAKVPDLYLLARLLGHSDARVTKLYAHLLPDHLERARGAVTFDAPVGIAEMRARARWEVD